MTVTIKDIIKSEVAISADKGELVFKELKESLSKVKDEDTIIVNFEGLDLINSAFLNTAIGQLYSNYDSVFLNKHLLFDDKNIDSTDMILIKKVLVNAKEFYANKELFDKNIKEVMGND